MKDNSQNHNSLPIIQGKSVEEPWYKEGLRFECTACGQCCTGAPGYTWITPEEIVRIANFLNMTLDDFVREHIRQIGHQYALLEKSFSNYDCIFLEGNRCSIYPVRPTQCRTFPWWPQILESEKTWQETAKRCEGINSQALLITKEEIEKNLDQQKKEDQEKFN